MITFHFTIAGASRTVDVGMGGSYYFDTKGGAEWELRDYYLNGNKSHWKEFPELPLIQPEKVLTLPLDITFDRSYTYEYDGEDVVDGRTCHVLRFEPVDPNGLERKMHHQLSSFHERAGPPEGRPDRKPPLRCAEARIQLTKLEDANRRVGAGERDRETGVAPGCPLPQGPRDEALEAFNGGRRRRNESRHFLGGQQGEE